MKYILWLLFVLTGCQSLQQKKTLFEDQLSAIPLEDQRKLEILFQRMMTGDYFSGTLFGNKPLTFQEFHDDPWKLSSYTMLNPYNHFYLEEGWNTWIKYQKLFPSQRFIFTKIGSKGGYEFLILINKTAFRKTFVLNHDLFEQVLGPHISVESIFQDFESQKKTFEQILNNHEGLVGVVLGYGKEGSMQVFHDWLLMHQILRETFYPLSPPIVDNKLPRNILTSMRFQEKKLLQRKTKWHQLPCFNENAVEDPYAELNNRTTLCEFLYPSWQERIFYIFPPNFTVVKDSNEARELKMEYNSALKFANETFNKKSFLQGFLEQYCKQE